MKKTRIRSARTERAPESLVEMLASLAAEEGTHETLVEGVKLTRRSHAEARHPAIYEPMIIFLAQGCKRIYLDTDALQYDSDRYLALSVPVPVECEIVDATVSKPLLAVSMVVEPAMLAEILVSLDEPARAELPVPRGIYANATPPELRDAVIRLLRCLRSPTDSRILGRQIVREIVYRVLQDEPGSARALATRNDQFMRIARVVQQVHTEFARDLSVEELAKRAGMSVSTFHHNFKAVTATSPLQYLKSIRLHRARMLMAHSGHNAGTAAAAVGYESASQFGREFKRMFGNSPAEDAAVIRAKIGAETVVAHVERPIAIGA